MGFTAETSGSRPFAESTIWRLAAWGIMTSVCERSMRAPSCLEFFGEWCEQVWEAVEVAVRQ